LEANSRSERERSIDEQAREYLEFVQTQADASNFFSKLPDIYEFLSRARHVEDWNIVAKLASAIAHNLVRVWPTWSARLDVKVSEAEVARRLELAQEILAWGLEASRHLGMKEQTAYFLAELSDLSACRRDFISILPYVAEFKALELGDDSADAWAYSIMRYAQAAVRLKSDLEASDRLLSTALGMYQRLPDREGQTAYCIYLLGHNSQERNDFAQARQYFQRAIELGKKLDYHYVVAGALKNLAAIAISEKCLEEARAFYEEVSLSAGRCGEIESAHLLEELEEIASHLEQLS
jgi:tetratricopeptide (TPR) repeat protein